MSPLRFFGYVIAALAVLALLVVAAFNLYGREESWALIFGPADMGPYDFVQVPRTGKPNDMLACPAGACQKGEPGIVTPHYAVPAATLFETVTRAFSHFKGKTVVIGANPYETRLRAVVYSPRIRIPSTMSVKVETSPDGGSDLYVYSRSQFGFYDMGRNSDNISDLLKAIDSALKDGSKP